MTIRTPSVSHLNGHTYWLDCQTRTQSACSLYYDFDGAHDCNTTISKIKKCCKLLWVRDCPPCTNISFRSFNLEFGKIYCVSASCCLFVCTRFRYLQKFQNLLPYCETIDVRYTLVQSNTKFEEARKIEPN